MHICLRQHLAFLLGILVLLSSLISCESVSITTNSTATPPTFTWGVTDHATNHLVKYSPNQAITLKFSGNYDIDMDASTPSGVKTISVQPDASWVCENRQQPGEPIGQSFSPLLVPYTSTQPATSGSALYELAWFYPSYNPMFCNPGFTYSSGGYSLMGIATNFANMQTSGTLVVTVVP